jgi:hypothetical protein
MVWVIGQYTLFANNYLELVTNFKYSLIRSIHIVCKGEFMPAVTVRDRILRSLRNRTGEVLLRADVATFADPSQVTRALQALIAEGEIVRVGYGVYAKATTNKITGKPRPRAGLSEIASEFLQKQGIVAEPGKAQRDYASGNTNQVPLRVSFYTGKRRVSRKISIGNTFVKYENAY